MKTTILVFATATSSLLADPGSEPLRPLLPILPLAPDAVPIPAETEELLAAKLAVHRDIVARLPRPNPIFSRAAPFPTIPTFEPVQFAKHEQRLPFTIHTRNGRRPETLQGYVRLSDQAIFLLDPESGKHHPASADPRFAPEQPDGETKSPLC